MKIKQGVSIEKLDIRMQRVLKAVEIIWKSHGEEAVITAGDKFTYENGKFIHSVGSLHPFGLALDFRHRYFSGPVKAIIANELENELGSDYDVVIERTHIHIEYDPKG